MDFQKTSPSSETVGFSKKCQKVDPPKIGHFRGVLLSSFFSKNPCKCLKTAILTLKSTTLYFLTFFQKTTLSASNWQFLEKIVDFRGNIAVLRHLQGFWKKMKKVEPP